MAPSSRLIPWLSRLVLLAVTLILMLIGSKFVLDPVGAASASGITLGSALAITNMRASFGAFPLVCAVIIFACLISRRRHVVGLWMAVTILGGVLLVRIYGTAADDTFSESTRVLLVEAVLFLLAGAALVLEGRRRAPQRPLPNVLE
jgi:hypothetical protein